MRFRSTYLGRRVRHAVEQCRHPGDDERAFFGGHELRQHDAGRHRIAGRRGALSQLVDLAPGSGQRVDERVEGRGGATRLFTHEVAPGRGATAYEVWERNNYCWR